MDVRVKPEADEAVISMYEGTIAGVSMANVTGWALDTHQPDTPIGIDLFLDDMKVATTIAGAFNQELYLRGKGNGFHQFDVKLPRIDPSALIVAGGAELTMRVTGSEDIIGAPFPLDRNALLQLSAGPVTIGQLEQFSDGRVEGWLANMDVGEAPPPLALAFDDMALPFSVIPERVNSIMHDGQVVSRWRFAAAVPASMFDGRVHMVTAYSGSVELEGSPILIGLSAASDITNAVATQARDLAVLRERLAILPSVTSTDALMDELAGRVLDRVDMLMSIYRDNVEHELGLMRNELVRQASGSVSAKSLSTIVAPALAPRGAARAPTQEILFDQSLTLLTGLADLKTGTDGPYALLSDTVEIDLQRPLGMGCLIVAEGHGARSATDVLQWQFSCDGAPFLGRYEVWDDGRWRFSGRLARLGSEFSGHTLSIILTAAYVEAATVGTALHIASISFPSAFLRGTACDDLPVAVAEQVAGQIGGVGWHSTEFGTESAYRWMSERANLRLDLKKGGERIITVLGEDSVPLTEMDETPLLLFADGQPLPALWRTTTREFQRWTASATLPDTVGGADLLFELVAGPGVAKSPQDYALLSDPRILSFSIRTVIWEVAPPTAAGSEPKEEAEILVGDAAENGQPETSGPAEAGAQDGERATDDAPVEDERAEGEAQDDDTLESPKS